MRKKAACFVVAFAIFAQKGVAITPKLENVLEGSHFYMACISKMPTTEEGEVASNEGNAEAENAEAVAAPVAAAQPENDAQVTALEAQLKKEIVHISPALFVNCDALTGHLKRKGQHALSKKFEDYAERLYNRPRANMRLEKIFQLKLPENDTPTSAIGPYFNTCAQAFHEELKQQANTWKVAVHNDYLDPDRPIFFFTRHLFKGFFDNDTDAFKTAYDHAKAKEAFYRDLKDAHSTLSKDPIEDMLWSAESTFHEAMETCKAEMRQNVQRNRHCITAADCENRLRGIDMVNPSYYYSLPRLATHLDSKLAKWQSRRQMLGQVCVEHNIQLA